MTFEMISWDLLLVVVSTGLGLVLSQWSAKSGIDRWLRPRVISYSGTARDGRISSIRHLGLPLGPDLLEELKADFKREKVLDYAIETIEVRYFRKLIMCKGVLSLVDPDGRQFRYTFSGRGEYLAGNINRGAIYVTLDCRAELFAWKVICLLRYTEPHRLHGYWFGDDGTAPGRFTMGVIQLTSNSS